MMRLINFIIVLICILTSAGWAKSHTDPYTGCLLFQDDVREGDDLASINDLRPNTLLRSWYRFGEPSQEKAYYLRKKLVQDLKQRNILVGGGISLSVVNNRDLARKDFDVSWLSVDLDGKTISKDNKQFGSLSIPGFRNYLIDRLIEQGRLGVVELALGETTGKIYYDDWSLGLKGDDGFIQWLKKKHKNKKFKWWKNYLAGVGVSLYKNKSLSRDSFKNLKGAELLNFQREWGKPDSWHGTNDLGQSAFLAYAYKKNLTQFITKLRAELVKNKLDHISIDVWGTAEWMADVSSKVNAVLNSPPDERWGFNWNTDKDYDLEKNRDRIKEIIKNEILSNAPAKMIYMFDHPNPFLTSFVKLSDHRQAQITQFFADLYDELGVNFVIRSYSEVQDGPGPVTKKVLLSLCGNKRKADD